LQAIWPELATYLTAPPPARPALELVFENRAI